MRLCVEVGADFNIRGIMRLAPVEPYFHFVILATVGLELVVAFAALILKRGEHGGLAAFVITGVGHRSFDCLLSVNGREAIVSTAASPSAYSWE
jgi:hypothetical protein